MLNQNRKHPKDEKCKFTLPESYWCAQSAFNCKLNFTELISKLWAKLKAFKFKLKRISCQSIETIILFWLQFMHKFGVSFCQLPFTNEWCTIMEFINFYSINSCLETRETWITSQTCPTLACYVCLCQLVFSIPRNSNKTHATYRSSMKSESARVMTTLNTRRRTQSITSAATRFHILGTR